MTRSDLIEIIARELPYGISEACRTDAKRILAALSSAGLAVVPKEATDGMGFVGGIAFEEAAFANQKHVFDAAKGAWGVMVAQAEFEQDRAMVAAEDLAGERG